MTAMRLAIGLALCFVGAPSWAQDRSTQVLLERVERLERSLNDLSRQLARGEPPRAAAPGAAGPFAAPAIDGPAYAQLETRLQQNEEQVRRLTGQLEEVDFRLRRLADRIDKLVTDVDFRLKELEGGRVAATTGPGAAVPPGAPAQLGAPPAGQPPPSVPPGLVVGPPPVAPAPAEARLPDGPPREQYDHAYGLLRRAAFPEAEAAFREFLRLNPNDKLSANAHYWLGETHYVRNQYDQAALAFVEGYKKFPEGAKAPHSLYKLGLTLQRLNQKQEACATYSELLRKFPRAEAHMKERAEAERKELACR